MEFLQNAWWFLLLIGVMILIHELGHYLAAVFFDVRVEAFALGFGPRLFGFRRGETDFKVCALPLGGFVKMTGEQFSDDPASQLDPRSFLSKPRWQRLIVVLAGPVMNILLAVGILTGFFMWRFPKPLAAQGVPQVGYVEPGSAADRAGIKPGDRIPQIESNTSPRWDDLNIVFATNVKKAVDVVVEHNGYRRMVQLTPEPDDRLGGIGNAGIQPALEVDVAKVEPDSPAAQAGLKEGDALVSAGGQAILNDRTLPEALQQSHGKAISMVVRRNGQNVSLTATPKYADDAKVWRLGVHMRIRQEFVKLGFVDAFRESISMNIKDATGILNILRSIVERRMSPKSIEGPIRIAKLSGEAAREGMEYYIRLMAAVSLNLAVFNLLPIPILDGGTILLLLIEMVMRRDLSLRVKEAVFKAGFVFLMMLVIFVLYNDITKA